VIHSVTQASEQTEAAKTNGVAVGKKNITTTAPANLSPAALTGRNRDKTAPANRTELPISNVGGLRLRSRTGHLLSL
jgi:hypothetical protein